MTQLQRHNLFGVLALVWVARSANAQSSVGPAAQALFDRGKELVQQGQFADACPKFEESQRLEPSSGTLINLANCYEQAGRLASAWNTYLGAASAAKRSGNSERETAARERGAALVPRLSTLLIRVASNTQSLPGLEVMRDGVAAGPPEWGLKLPIDAGKHEVVATAPGHVPLRLEISVIGEGASFDANVPELALQAAAPSLKPAPVAPATSRSDAPTAQRTLGATRAAAFVAGGIGVLGVALGTVFGLASKSKHDEVGRYCTGAACFDPRGVSASNSARSEGNVSTALMIVGGVGLATGAVLWFAAPSVDDKSPAQVGLGFGTVQIEGAF